MEQKPTTVRRRSDRYLQEDRQQESPQPRSAPQPVFDYSRVEPEEPSTVSRMAAGMTGQPARPAAQETPQPRTPHRRTESQTQAAPRRRNAPTEDTPPEPVYRSRRSRGMLQSRTPATELKEKKPGQPRRPSAVQKNGRKKQEEREVPVWMRACLIAGVLLIMAGAAASLIMTGWLKQQQQARDEAEQRIVTAHPLQYRDLIERYAEEYNLQPAFVAAIILNESSFNSRAESSVGARGLMQLMPDTAQWIAHRLGLDDEWDVDRLWDPETNIRFGCWYFRYLNSLFNGDPVTVTSAYHTGQGEVSGWLLNSEYSADGLTLSLDTMPEGPTKTYAGRVIRDYGIYDRLYFHAFNPEITEETADE